jgi:tetratricopeptide (TPR) repeat protein
MVIADTGSKDDTIAIAREFGAQVFSIPWTDDFAAARNLSLAPVKADWVLSLDADEQLDSKAAQQIPLLLKKQNVAGYQVTIRNYVLSLNDRVWDRPAKPNDSRLPAAQQYPGYVEHQNVRLFRRHPEIHFVGRVHESVGPEILRRGRKLGNASFLIHHFGLAASEETRAAKNRFYRDLGRRKILEIPDNAQAHLELGLVEMDNFGNAEEAQKLFERACRLDPGFALAWFFQGVTLSKLDRHEAALTCLEHAEHLGQRTALTAELAADSLYNLGQFQRAAKTYETALRRDPQNPLLESKLGLADLRSGSVAVGLDRLRRAVVSRPHAPEAHERLVLALVWTNRLADAAQAAMQKLQMVPGPGPGDYLRAASLWAKLQDWTSANATLESGLCAFPDHPALRQGLAEARSSLQPQDSSKPALSIT